MSILGFTGTRGALTSQQVAALDEALSDNFPRVDELHHGDCIGADATAHSWAAHFGIHIVVHPPIKSDYRAWCAGDDYRERKPYASRNPQIVAESDWLLAMPKDKSPGGGTWMTIRMARKAGIPVRVVYPDGSLDIFNGDAFAEVRS